MVRVVKVWEPVAGKSDWNRWPELWNLGNTWPDICSLGTGGQSNVIREQEPKVVYLGNRWSWSHVAWKQVVGVLSLGTAGAGVIVSIA